MNEPHNAAKQTAANKESKHHPLAVHLLATFIVAVRATISIFALLWVTVFPAFGVLYLLGWLR